MSEFAYVIERGDSPVSKPLYFAGFNKRGLPALWRDDPNLAVRFCRREDAEKVSYALIGLNNRVAEHGWMKDTTP
jgi:hypothetical protein